MTFGLVNSPSAFQRIMDETFEGMDDFVKKYIDDALIHCADIPSHIKHLNIFYKRVKEKGIVLSTKLFQTMIDFLRYDAIWIILHYAT